MILLLGLVAWCVVAFVLAPLIGRHLKKVAAAQSSSTSRRGGVGVGAGAAPLTGPGSAGQTNPSK